MMPVDHFTTVAMEIKQRPAYKTLYQAMAVRHGLYKVHSVLHKQHPLSRLKLKLELMGEG